MPCRRQPRHRLGSQHQWAYSQVTVTLAVVPFVARAVLNAEPLTLLTRPCLISCWRRSAPILLPLCTQRCASARVSSA